MHKKVLTLAILGVLSASCATSPHPARDQTPVMRDPNAQTVIAELALEKGDCRSAAENYAAAAKNGSVALARRASEVALACEHMPAAWQSVQRWRAIDPEDKNAATVYGTVALKLYKIPEARTSLGPIIKSISESADPELVSLIGLLSDETDSHAVLAALDSSIEPQSTSPGLLATFGVLALESYDFARAERRAQQALERDDKSVMALRLLAQVRALRGDSAGAIEAARKVMELDAKGGAFQLAETLASLDRLEEARQELERLRGNDSAAEEIDRRLALLAFQGGDYPDAQRRFASLVSRGEATDAAMFYLGDIAVITGDKDAALVAYRQLVNSSLAVAARTRAAGLLLDKEDRASALALLDNYVVDHPESSFDLMLAKASLLAEHGDAESGVTLLAAALDRYPKHPSIEYERAVLLERAGKISESVQAFDKLLDDRPDDPTLMNALGYTLADHNMELPRAENLIRKALVVMPDSPAVLDSLAWVRLRRGDSRDALKTFEKAYGIGHDPEIAAHWGEALWTSGNQPEARRVWAAALARHPENEALKKTLHKFVKPGAQ
jgi:tetratricopeptide (TPR) repeat protein